jgi:uncharacterized protein DUF3224
MPNIPMLALALLGTTALLAGQDDPRTDPGEIAALAAVHLTPRTTPQNGLNEEDVMDQDHSSIRASQAKTNAKAPRKPGRAEAKIAVQNSEAKPYDQGAGPALMEIHLRETFTGDINGESPVRALQILHDDHSASLVSVQRFSGKLRGREGTFVLQGSETVESGRIKATWFVVPGSGTGELAGLRGEGGFEGDFGRGSNGTLNYWFE